MYVSGELFTTFTCLKLWQHWPLLLWPLWPVWLHSCPLTVCPLPGGDWSLPGTNGHCIGMLSPCLFGGWRQEASVTLWGWEQLYSFWERPLHQTPTRLWCVSAAEDPALEHHNRPAKHNQVFLGAESTMSNVSHGPLPTVVYFKVLVYTGQVLKKLKDIYIFLNYTINP